MTKRTATTYITHGNGGWTVSDPRAAQGPYLLFEMAVGQALHAANQRSETLDKVIGRERGREWQIWPYEEKPTKG